MKKALAIVFSVFILQSFCLAQEEEKDDSLARFAGTKIPVSMQNFSFFEEYATFTQRQLKSRFDSLSPVLFKISFYRNYKDIDSVTLLFLQPAEDNFNRAVVTEISVRFKTEAYRNLYLKSLGKPVTDMRWDFVMKTEKGCKGVQVYKQGTKSIRIKTYTDCG
jgi:hypothetical protein